MQVVFFSVLLDYSYLDELRTTLFNEMSVKNPDMFLCTDRMKRLFINLTGCLYIVRRRQTGLFI